MARREIHFLSLPLELRHQIYSELLITSFSEPVLLWHDRKGREKSTSIHPQILRVCKQINAEAAPLLYERNILRLDMMTPEYYSCTVRTNIGRSQAFIRGDAALWTRHFEQPGLLSTSCLQRLAHIEFVISIRSVWAKRPRKYHDVWSGTGNLFVQLLRLLAEEEINESLLKKKKRVVIIVYKDYNPLSSTDQKWMLFPGGNLPNRESAMAAKLRPLVEAVGKKRGVSIYEILEDVRVDGDEHEREAQTVTREVSIKDFSDL
ncbi:MAG: hypothetical protein Q9221_002445 [Calogaya cf. arnoldii]